MTALQNSIHDRHRALHFQKSKSGNSARDLSQSNEQAHKHLLSQFKAQPLLSLELRLGEGSGGILAYPLINSACVFINEMASFESAGVSDAK